MDTNTIAIHAAQRFQELRALMLREQWPFVTFERPCRDVAIQANHQEVAKCAGLLEVAHVADVQQVEYAIGEYHAAALPVGVQHERGRLVLCQMVSITLSWSTPSIVQMK